MLLDFGVHLKKRNKRLKNNNGVQEAMKNISKYNAKSILKYDLYLNEYFNVKHILEKFSSRKILKRERFTRFIKRQQYEARFINQFKKVFGENCIVCFGDWGEVKQRKGIFYS
jgi:cytochrome c